MRAPDATRSANFAAGMGFALVTAVGWGLNWPVPKYLLTELPLLSTLKQSTIDAFALAVIGAVSYGVAIYAAEGGKP